MNHSDQSRLPLTPAPSNDILPHPGHHRQSLDPTFTLGPAAINDLPPSGGSPIFKHGGLAGSPLTYQRNQPPPSPVSPNISGGKTLELSHNQNQLKDTSAGSRPNLQAGLSLQPAPRGKARVAQALAKPKVVLKNPPPPPANIIKRYNPRTKKSPPLPSPQVTSPGSKKRKARDSSDNESKASSPKKKVTQRRTAHSEIERNRRVKINSANDRLKALIPACEGREQTKLNILEQAAKYIEYLQESIELMKEKLEVSYASGSDKSISPPIFPSIAFQKKPFPGDNGDDSVLSNSDDDGETKDRLSVRSSTASKRKPSSRLQTNQRNAKDSQPLKSVKQLSYQTSKGKTGYTPVRKDNGGVSTDDDYNYDDDDDDDDEEYNSPPFFGFPPSDAGSAAHSPSIREHSVPPPPRKSHETLPSLGEALDLVSSPVQQPADDVGDHQASEALLQLASSDRRPMSVADMLNGGNPRA